MEIRKNFKISHKDGAIIVEFGSEWVYTQGDSVRVQVFPLRNSAGDPNRIPARDMDFNRLGAVPPYNAQTYNAQTEASRLQ
jgi:hypothetical protein